MNWGKFFKPSVSKIIIFVTLILIFGVPAYLHNCSSYLDLNEGTQECTGPSLILFNYLSYSLTVGVLDVSYSWNFNVIIIFGYLAVIYLLLSLIFHLSSYKWKRALIYTVSAVALILVGRLIISLISIKSTVI